MIESWRPAYLIASSSRDAFVATETILSGRNAGGLYGNFGNVLLLRKKPWLPRQKGSDGMA